MDPESHRRSLLSTIYHYFTTGQYCDVHLICQDKVKISAHWIVLVMHLCYVQDVQTFNRTHLQQASVSRILREASKDLLPNDDGSFISLPNFSSQDVKDCIETLYRSLAGQGSTEDLNKVWTKDCTLN